MKSGSYKCSQFVFDVTREAGARLPLIDSGFPLAGALADPSRNLKNWRILAPGESPQPGDIAAIPSDGPGYTGHTGFITSGPEGNNSAHTNDVSPTPGQFTNESGLTFRRYTGE